MKPLTQAEYDDALVDHDPDGNSLIVTRERGCVRLYGENGLVTLEAFDDGGEKGIELSEAECRKLAAALVRLADIWCVS